MSNAYRLVLRRGSTAVTSTWIRMKSTRPSYVAPASSIPPPQPVRRQQQPNESWGSGWGQQQQQQQPRTTTQAAPPPRWGGRSRSQPQGQQTGGVRLMKPQKYKSLVYFPEEVTLKYPTAAVATSAANSSNNNKSSLNYVKPFELECLNFAISKPGSGGHVLIGPNGSGKSLLVKYLTDMYELENVILDSKDDVSHVDYKLLLDGSNGEDHYDDDIAYVSFESHHKLLQEHPHYTVHNVITGDNFGNLNKVAQYLVVRFGLYPLLHRTISTLSTGEIRKCLLVSALCQQPKLLLLENPFDGLDEFSRDELRSIVSKTLKGLSNSGKLLVAGVTPDYVPPTQVVISTHRPEDILDDISTVSLIMTTNNNGDEKSDRATKKLVTFQRPPGWSQEQLLYMGLGVDKDFNKDVKGTRNVIEPWNDEKILSRLPTVDDIRDIWSRTTIDNHNETTTKKKTLISLKDVEIRRYQDGKRDEQQQQHGDGGEGSGPGMTSSGVADTDEEALFATLLHKLSWDIDVGQHWLIAGGNGAGKSTLSRFLLSSSTSSDGAVADTDNSVGRNDNNGVDGSSKVDTTRDFTSGEYLKDDKTVIGWVSTESHLGSMNNNGGANSENAISSTWNSAYDMITHDGSVPDDVATTIISWVFGGSGLSHGNKNGGGDDDHRRHIAMLKTRSLDELSQGEQKLCLLASALTKRPNVLILDEITQGLDWLHRRHILALLERICEATHDTMSLIYITHYKEEYIPSVSHVLHLDHGTVVYQGEKKQMQT